MAHRYIDNPGIERGNDREFLKVLDRLFSVYYSIYHWHGFPGADAAMDSALSSRIEHIFATGGLIGAAVSESRGPIIGTAAGCGGVNWYGVHNAYTLTTAVDSEQFPRESCVVQETSPTHTPPTDIIEWFARQIYILEKAAEVNARGQTTPLIITCEQGQELTCANKYEQIAGFKPVVYGYAAFSDAPQMQYFPPAPFVAKDLHQMRRDLYGEFYNWLGIRAKTGEKAERLVASEVAADDEAVAANMNVWHAERVAFRDGCRERLGWKDFGFTVGYDEAGEAKAASEGRMNALIEGWKENPEGGAGDGAGAGEG